MALSLFFEATVENSDFSILIYNTPRLSNRYLNYFREPPHGNNAS